MLSQVAGTCKVGGGLCSHNTHPTLIFIIDFKLYLCIAVSDMFVCVFGLASPETRLPGPSDKHRFNLASNALTLAVSTPPFESRAAIGLELGESKDYFSKPITFFSAYHVHPCKLHAGLGLGWNNISNWNGLSATPFQTYYMD